MSFLDCLAKRVEAGEISSSEASRISSDYQKHYRKYMKSHGDANAADLAATEVAELNEKIYQQKRFNTLKQVATNQRLSSELTQTFKDLNKWYDNLNPVSKALVTKPQLEGVVRDFLERVYTRQRSVATMAAGKMSGFIEKYMSDPVGRMKYDEIREIWRAAGGATDVSPNAKKYGKEIREAFDWLHEQYTVNGGVIGKIDNWMPQMHDSYRVRQTSFDDWFNLINDKIDYGRMTNPETGMPYIKDSPEAIAAMKRVYREISTDGLSDIADRVAAGKSKTGGTSKATKRSSSRFLVFRSVDDQLAYNDVFGSGKKGLFDTILGHNESISRDIGMMQMMGPNPNSAFGNMSLMHERETGRPLANFSEGMMDVLSGGTLTTGHESSAYKMLMSAQSWFRASYLGSAVIPAIGDSTFVAATARMNGLSASRAMIDYFGGMSKQDKSYLSTMGYIHEMASGSLSSRVMEDASSLGVAGSSKMDKIQAGTSGMAHGVLRVSGLLNVTEHAKNVTSLQLHAQVASNAGKKFDELDELFRNSALEHGITEADWDNIRKAKPFTDELDGRGKFIRPDDVAAINLDSALKYTDWDNTLRRVSVNEPPLRVKTITTGAWAGKGAGKSGSVSRAINSSLFMFKGFPLSVVYNTMIPAYKAAATRGNIEPLLTIAIGTTVMGGLALNATEVVKGRDPIAMDFSDPKFVASAMLKGGFMGIFGDMLLRDHTKYGSNLLADLSGPVFQNINALGFQVGFGNLQKLIEGEETELANDLFQVAKRNVPGESLWFWRAAFERYLLDTIEKEVNPNFNYDVAKHEQKLYNQHKQRYWWGKGDTSPSRKPDFDKAIPNY